MSAPSVVVINNDALLVTLLVQALADASFHAIGAVGDQRGYAAIRTHQPEFVVLDAPYSPQHTDWFVLAFRWQEGGTHQAYALPLPLQLDQLRATLTQALGPAAPPPLERSRGADDHAP